MNNLNPKLVFSILVLAGIPAYIFCGIAHVCMFGHMQHPPYAAGHFAADLWWVIAFLGAAVFGWRAKVRRRRSLVGLLTFLVLSRLLLGSAGGGLFLFELPACIVLAVVAIRTAVRGAGVVRGVAAG